MFLSNRRKKFESKKEPLRTFRDDDNGKAEKKVEKSSKNGVAMIGDSLDEIVCHRNKPSSSSKMRSPIVPSTRNQIEEFLNKNDKMGDNLVSKAELKNTYSRFPAFRSWQARRNDPNSNGTDGDGRISQEEMQDLLNFVTRLNYQVKP